MRDVFRAWLCRICIVPDVMPTAETSYVESKPASRGWWPSWCISWCIQTHPGHAYGSSVTYCISTILTPRGLPPELWSRFPPLFRTIATTGPNSRFICPLLENQYSCRQLAYCREAIPFPRRHDICRPRPLPLSPERTQNAEARTATRLVTTGAFGPVTHAELFKSVAAGGVPLC